MFVVFWCCVQHPFLFTLLFALYYVFSYIRIICTYPIWQPSLIFPCPQCLLNCFQTGRGECLANLLRWGFDELAICDVCLQQTMKYTVEMCPLTKVEGGLQPTSEVNIPMEMRQMCKTVRTCIEHKYSY